MQLVDLGRCVSGKQFKVFRGALDTGGVVKAINAKEFRRISRSGRADELTAIAKTFGAKGLAFIKIENGEWKSPIVKFFSEAEKEALRSKLRDRRRRSHFVRGRQMGHRLRSAGTPAACASPKFRKLTEDSEHLIFSG